MHTPITLTAKTGAAATRASQIPTDGGIYFLALKGQIPFSLGTFCMSLAPMGEAKWNGRVILELR